MYPSPKKLNYLQKKNLEHPDKKLKSMGNWEYLNPMRNLISYWKNISLPPLSKKKRKSQSTRKRKNITPRKSFDHPKIASTIMKKPQTPHLKILNFSINLNSIGKDFNSFEVTRPIKPSPHEKISIPDNLTPFRKLQTSHAHENGN